MAPVVCRHQDDLPGMSTDLAEDSARHSKRSSKHKHSSKNKSSSSSSKSKSSKSDWPDIEHLCISPPPLFRNPLHSDADTMIDDRETNTSPSPSLKSAKSDKSSHSDKSFQHSEVGDSGVSSERDSPSPHEPLSYTATESDDDCAGSNISVDSLHNTKTDKSTEFDKHTIFQLKTTSKRPRSKGHSRHMTQKKSIPQVILRQICERAQQFEKRRKEISTASSTEHSNLAMLRGLAVRRPPPPSRLHHTSQPCLSSSSSLISSSAFSSTTSLYEEESEDSFPLYSRPMSVCEELDEDSFTSSSPSSCRDLEGGLIEVPEEQNAGEAFAGIRTIFSPPQKSTIRSQKGTVRGVRNRVRAGIATFTSDQRILKLYSGRERGRVVVYLTTLGIVRHTYERCQKIKKILWTLSVRFDERDVFMNRDTQIQLLDRLGTTTVSLPHVFIEGQYFGGADLIEHLNESGELRRLLQPYRVSSPSSAPCDSCGGYRMLPCPVCNGSKKSLNRNHFTLEFVALKCCCCDEAGLVACQECGP